MQQKSFSPWLLNFREAQLEYQLSVHFTQLVKSHISNQPIFFFCLIVFFMILLELLIFFNHILEILILFLDQNKISTQLKTQFLAFCVLSVYSCIIVLVKNEMQTTLDIALVVGLASVSLATLSLLFWMRKFLIAHLAFPVNILALSLLISRIAAKSNSYPTYFYQLDVVGLWLLDSQKLYVNWLNILTLKIVQAVFTDIADFTGEFWLGLVLLLFVSYVKLKFTRTLFATSESGREWSEIVNSFFTQKVFITCYNDQTGKLELINSNQAAEYELSMQRLENVNSKQSNISPNSKNTVNKSKTGKSQKQSQASPHHLDLQEQFNAYLQKMFISSDELHPNPNNSSNTNAKPVHLQDFPSPKAQDLKQYLVHKHIFLLEQAGSSASKNSTRWSDFSFANNAFKQRIRAGSNFSLLGKNRRRSSSFFKLEQTQVEYRDHSQGPNRRFLMKVDQFGMGSKPQLVVILEDESRNQEIMRLKNEKSVLETFLFSVLKNMQEKLRIGLQSDEIQQQRDLQELPQQQFSDNTLRLESYLLMNEVYCILDYFVIKAKKLGGNLSRERARKVLNVEQFMFGEILLDLQMLFGDKKLIIQSQGALENQGILELEIQQDRRKVKQVLIAVIGSARQRAAQSQKYYLSVFLDKTREWTAVRCEVSFQSEDLNQSNFHEKAYSALNGSNVELLNQVEEEVLRETIMLVGPYKAKEILSPDGILTLQFSFFTNLTAVYDDLTVNTGNTRQTRNTTVFTSKNNNNINNNIILNNEMIATKSINENNNLLKLDNEKEINEVDTSSNDYYRDVGDSIKEAKKELLLGSLGLNNKYQQKNHIFPSPMFFSPTSSYSHEQKDQSQFRQSKEPRLSGKEGDSMNERKEEPRDDQFNNNNNHCSINLDIDMNASLERVNDLPDVSSPHRMEKIIGTPRNFSRFAKSKMQQQEEHNISNPSVSPNPFEVSNFDSLQQARDNLINNKQSKSKKSFKNPQIFKSNHDKLSSLDGDEVLDLEEGVAVGDNIEIVSLKETKSKQQQNNNNLIANDKNQLEDMNIPPPIDQPQSKTKSLSSNSSHSSSSNQSGSGNINQQQTYCLEDGIKKSSSQTIKVPSNIDGFLQDTLSKQLSSAVKLTNLQQSSNNSNHEQFQLNNSNNSGNNNIISLTNTNNNGVLVNLSRVARKDQSIFFMQDSGLIPYSNGSSNSCHPQMIYQQQYPFFDKNQQNLQQQQYLEDFVLPKKQASQPTSVSIGKYSARNQIRAQTQLEEKKDVDAGKLQYLQKQLQQYQQQWQSQQLSLKTIPSSHLTSRDDINIKIRKQVSKKDTISIIKRGFIGDAGGGGEEDVEEDAHNNNFQ